MPGPTNETGLTHAIRKAIEREHPESFFWKVHGGPMQESGIPDLAGCVDGLFVGIEVKFQRPGESADAARNRATPSQRRQIGRINAAGGIAGVVISVEEALDLIQRGKRKRKQREKQ